MGDVLPVSRFSPSAGLWVDINGGSVVITGSMEMYGEEANAERAKSVQDSINKTWTKTFPDGYLVQTSVTVTYRGPGSAAGNATQIEVKKMSGASNVASSGGGRKMTLNSTSQDVYTWVCAHEFGHVIGLDDRYTEDVGDVRQALGTPRHTTPTSGYNGNIMAEHGGGLESKNVGDVAAENNPSSWWVNDDDNVRNWVNSHGGPDIARLSTAAKLNAINILMSGWISDDDMDCIIKIMRNVRDKAEADAIRKGIDPLDFTSIGQRTQFRVAAARMP
ncbi:MAG: hypothetical protein KIT36_22460 [Alphaproteobacteria bacterium]|nr:hypothetical protein [Alphaproteobacteria bacterium]